jgi:membrane-associated phospholipid phosphatase
MVTVAYVAAQIGGALYTDPRPFAVGHFRPLIAHIADNGFPSDHALMAAALLAAVALARVRWALMVLPLAVVVEWARVGAGLHHPIDVVGSDLCVAVGALVAVVVAPLLTRIVLPLVPGRFLDLVAASESEQKIA